MGKPILHQFYLSLIPNLLTELFFFIPKNEISQDIIEKFEFFKTTNIFNKIYVMDYNQGPMEYKNTRSNKHLLLKTSDLDKNLFSLLEKKSEVKEYEFDYILEKYFELAECLFYITNWMKDNMAQMDQYSDGVLGIFHIQSLNYKKHFESLVKNFYPSRAILPKGNFNAQHLIETYFPDIESGYNNSKKRTVTAPIVQIDNQSEKKPQQKKLHKTLLVTDLEAETVLLKHVFNLDIKQLE
ncbi:hypothetical protein [Algibacter sp. L1A34]|uniref:hypothetical protein n=1 Tax=Algibacter sp. L1A34 TaxID=2686365 RepID=UPI00131CDBE4|nr:hypothetical protein [Algibacter sp. L1A34]